VAKKPRKAEKDIPPEFELPELLRMAQTNAIAKMKPSPNEQDDKLLPNLKAFLTPFAMPDPHHKGDGNPKTVLRESIVLVSFDRRAGVYKVNLSDKLLGLGGSAMSISLCSCLSDVEVLLANGAFIWSSRDDY